jgi:hypothetical protein
MFISTINQNMRQHVYTCFYTKRKNKEYNHNSQQNGVWHRKNTYENTGYYIPPPLKKVSSSKLHHKTIMQSIHHVYNTISNEHHT